jgi:sialic acid synthase SpsE
VPLRDDRCYVIAEAGSNHYGNYDHAVRLIQAAKEAGADACKFQLFRLADILRDPTGAGRPGECGDPKTELPPEWVPLLADVCREYRIDFLCTPFSAWAVEVLDPYVEMWKIGSFEWKRQDIWDAVLATDKPIICSTGRGRSQESEIAYALLHCVSKYPCPESEMNLPWYGYLDEQSRPFGGLSDHTLSTVIPALAVARGARIIEKHFRLDDTPPESPDHSFALTPAQLAEMVANIRLAELTCWRTPQEVTLASYPNRREE